MSGKPTPPFHPNITPSFIQQLRVQRRVIWALTMREVITRFGREGIGVVWLVAEPAMFIIGVMLLFSNIDRHVTYSIAEYLAVSYPTLLLWRNGTNRIINALEVNRALLHHQPIRPIDIIYSRILLEFSGAAGAFVILFIIFIQIDICQWPADFYDMAFGYLMVVWFSFSFALIMAALSEISESIERISHLILYLMLPVSGVFIPLNTIPEQYREALLYFPLVNAVEYFHAGYYGNRLITYYDVSYTVFVLTGMTLFALTLTNVAINRVQLR